MPPRQKKIKPSDPAFLHLMKNSKISFDGPVSRSEWPEQYTGVFQDIWKMDGKRFEDLPNTRDLESLPRRIMSDFKLRISKLAMAANECRRQWRNESEWRDELEPKVFQRFDEEFNWSAFYVIFWRTEKINYFS
jgi:hypothetical protein